MTCRPVRRRGPAVTTELVSILRKTGLLGSVPAADLEAVAAASRLRVFGRGRGEFTTGDPGDTVIVVVSGRVKVVVRSADGGELTLAVVHPAACSASSVPRMTGPRSAEAETLEERRLLLIPVR